MTSTPSDPTTGDYPDRDLPGGDVEVPEGSYTDEETPEEKRGEDTDVRGPADRGEYTDSDVATQHRAAPPKGGYTSKDSNRTGTTDEVEENPHG